MIVKKYGIDFDSSGGALTLPVKDVSEKPNVTGWSSRTHKDGWTISGIIHEDYYSWVNEFQATHPTYGDVKGNFEKEVYADSEKGFQDFYRKHKPEAWDYDDI